MSAVLEFTRNVRAADSAERAERCNWLADKEEAELIFGKMLDLAMQLYRGSSLSHVNRDLDGVSVHLSDEEAADDHLRTHYERWQDTLDPVSVDRFNRFGWPDVFEKQEARA